MFAYAAIPLTCWLCALIVRPQKPLVGNEVQEMVYARLLGRHQRLLILALIVTMIVFLTWVVTLPQRVDPDMNTVRHGHRTCDYPSVGFPTCYVLQRDGMWSRQELESDGTWIVVATVSSLPLTAMSDDDLGIKP